MNIFITGIAGFLGSHLAERFSSGGMAQTKRKTVVWGNDNYIGGDPANVPMSVLHWNIECADVAGMAKAMRGADVLYHCAALAHEGLSVFSPALICQNIYGASAAVFSAAIQAGVKRIVFCSSMARYGDGHLPPFTEDMGAGRYVLPPQPVDPYGVSKLAAERLLAVLADAHGFEYVIAVPHNIIGPRQKYDDPFRNVASIMINRMLQGQPPIIYGDGNQKRCFSFVADCVDALAMMATAPVSGEVINIGPDQGEITINELARILMDLTGFKGEPIYMPGRPQEVKEAWCSSDKARRLLGYEARTPLRDGLQSMVDHIRSRGPKPFNYHLPLEIVNDKTPRTWVEKRI